MKRILLLASLLAATNAWAVSPRPIGIFSGWPFSAPSIPDKDAVNPKSPGDIVFDSTAVGFFGWDGSSWINFGGGTGGIAGVSAGTGLVGGGNSGVVPLAVDVGTTANKIVQLDGSGKLPAVDGSQLINLPGGGSGVTAVAPVGSLPNNNGATISDSTLTLQPADLTHPGVVTIELQQFAGDKIFERVFVGEATPFAPVAHMPLAVFSNTPNSAVAIFGRRLEGPNQPDGALRIETYPNSVNLQGVASNEGAAKTMTLNAQGGAVTLGHPSLPGDITLLGSGLRIAEGSQGAAGQVLTSIDSQGMAEWRGGVPGTLCGWYDISSATTISNCNGVDPNVGCPTGFTQRSTSSAVFCTAN